MESEGFNERTYEVLSAIPVYPEECSMKDIKKVTGKSIKAIKYIITNLRPDVPICYDSMKYSWLSSEAKRSCLNDRAVRTC